MSGDNLHSLIASQDRVLQIAENDLDAWRKACLRAMVQAKVRGHELARLRAAAERIELAETRLESAREVIAAYADESIRLRAENERLTAANAQVEKERDALKREIEKLKSTNDVMRECLGAAVAAFATNMPTGGYTDPTRPFFGGSEDTMQDREAQP